MTSSSHHLIQCITITKTKTNIPTTSRKPQQNQNRKPRHYLLKLKVKYLEKIEVKSDQLFKIRSAI